MRKVKSEDDIEGMVQGLQKTSITFRQLSAV